MNENRITLINKRRKTGNEYNYTDSLNINNSEGWIMTVQCLRGLNIWWLQNWQFATLFAQVFVMRHRMTCFRFLCFSSGLTCGLLKNHRTPQQLCCFTPIATVQYQWTSVITMVVSQEFRGDHGFLLCAQGTFCFKRRGSSWPCPLRSDGSWDDQVGEAGLVEH